MATKDAVTAADVVFLATPFQANEEALKGLEQALHLEHMTLLWVRMVRINGASPHMVWAALRRGA